MNKEQIRHVSEILIKAMERAVEKKNATAIEADALCKIAYVLIELNKAN